MQTLLLLLSALVTYVEAICTGSFYWDPLTNACVHCTQFYIQSALGILPIFIMETLPQINVSLHAQQPLIYMQTTSIKLVYQVLHTQFSLPLESNQNILR